MAATMGQTAILLQAQAQPHMLRVTTKPTGKVPVCPSPSLLLSVMVRLDLRQALHLWSINVPIRPQHGGNSSHHHQPPRVKHRDNGIHVASNRMFVTSRPLQRGLSEDRAWCRLLPIS